MIYIKWQSKIKIYGGIEENNCDILLKDFFKKIR